MGASGTRPRGPRGDRGATALEFAAALPLALFVIFFAYQAWVASTTVERVENIARTGAREASQDYSPDECRRYALNTKPHWISDYEVEGGATTVDGTDAVYCRVKAKLPLLWKGIPLDYTVTRTYTLPLG
ncbi:hypothetical protein AB0J52_10410 [Spirillospora sp. NPDC049652]